MLDVRLNRMESYYILTLASVLAWVLSLYLTGKKVMRIEGLLEHQGVGHSLVEGNEMTPIAFYIGLIRCRPTWCEREKEIDNEISVFRPLLLIVVALTLISGCSTFVTIWNLLTE